MKKNKSFLKKLTFTLISLSLLITVFTALAVSAETPIKTVGETVDIEKAFSGYTVQETAAGSDEYVGDYQYTVYYDTKKGEVTSGYGGTPVVVYTVNHPSVKRIGTDSNEKIISSMLDRGYVVIVLDYLENEKASGSALENSTQLFMRQFCFRKDNLVTDTKVLPSGYFRDIFHAPSDTTCFLIRYSGR